jgi:hypothetical protein
MGEDSREHGTVLTFLAGVILQCSCSWFNRPWGVALFRRPAANAALACAIAMRGVVNPWGRATITVYYY